jgi:hypothetical protein
MKRLVADHKLTGPQKDEVSKRKRSGKLTGRSAVPKNLLAGMENA